jgi:protein O-GlcNAc transferase
MVKVDCSIYSRSERVLSRICVFAEEDKMLAIAHQHYKGGNYHQALEHCNTVYERNPNRTDGLLLLGAIYYQVSSLSSTLSRFLIFLLTIINFESERHSASNHIYLDFELWQLHDFDTCIAKNEAAIRIDPEFAECYGNMANALKVNMIPSVVLSGIYSL